ncbi:hypothetical protein JNL27_07735, partial [bacterium]|nr:hypothetical protein [bacterium]
MKRFFTTFRLIWEMAKIQNEVLAADVKGTTTISGSYLRAHQDDLKETLKNKISFISRKLKNRVSSFIYAITAVGRLKIFDKDSLNTEVKYIEQTVFEKTQMTMRKFVEENITLEKENQWFRQVIQQERNYSQMLIKLNNVTQNLFTITDRKVLLKTVTSSLCEELNFNSAVLWIYDKAQNKLVPISWSNATLDSLNSLDIRTDKRPYSDLLNHRKSYFLVDDMEGPSQIDNHNLSHIHQLREIL